MGNCCKCKKCNKCSSTRLASVSAKCSDACSVVFEDGYVEEGYVPENIGIGGGDYLEFQYCLDCGMIQDDFPIDLSRYLDNEH
jgi:hypothetical protein